MPPVSSERLGWELATESIVVRIRWFGVAMGYILVQTRTGLHDPWAVRAFLIACTAAVSYALGPFGLRGLPAAGVGFLIAMLVLLAELRAAGANYAASRSAAARILSQVARENPH